MPLISTATVTIGVMLLVGTAAAGALLGACSSPSGDTNPATASDPRVSSAPDTSSTPAPDSGGSGVPLAASSFPVWQTDLLVRTTGLDLVGSEKYHFGTVDSWSFEVAEVLHRGVSPQTTWHTPGSPVVLPAVVPGYVMVATVDAGVGERLATEAAGELLVGLGYTPPDKKSFPSSGWGLSFVAREADDGSLKILVPPRGDMWTERIAELHRGYGETLSPAELLANWIAEGDAERQGHEPGPITEAFAAVWRAAFERPSRHEQWYALPPERRPLAIELTPPEVLDDLATVRLLIDIERSHQEHDRFLVIKSDSGIVYAASLGAGNHPADVLTASGDQWRLVVTDDPVDGDDATVAVITGDEWNEALVADGSWLLLTYDGDVAATEILDSADGTQLLAEWAEADRQEP